MSTYQAKVFKFLKENVLKHDNADSLSIYKVNDTDYISCIRTQDWINNDGSLKHNKVIFLEPDTIVNSNRSEFSFLKGQTNKLNEPTDIRIKAKKLRGINSFGLLLPVGEDIPEETDMWDILELKHWNPPEPSESLNCGNRVTGAEKDFSKYDVDNLMKYAKVFEGETIVGTLKIHGANQRVQYKDDQIWVGSRQFWVKDGDNDFWKGYRSVPGLEKCVKENNITVFGENYGNNAKFREDCLPNERKFRAFDIYDNIVGKYLDFDDFHKLCVNYDIPICPIIYRGPFDIEKLKVLVEQDSPLCKGQASEGIVIVTEKEKWNHRLGRCKAKIVSCRYFETK